MRRKTIAIIGESYIGTGKGLYPVELFKALNKISKKYNFKLYLRGNAPFNGPNVVKVKTLNNTETRVFSGLGYHIPLFNKLRKDKSIDLIHAYDVKTNIVALLLRKPRVVTEYDLFPLEYKFPFNYIFKFLYRLLGSAKKIICVSDAMKKWLIEKIPSTSKKAIRIHLGVDTKRFVPPKKRSNGPITIGILGNLDPEGELGDIEGKLGTILDRISKDYGKNVRIILGGKRLPESFDKLKSRSNVIFRGFIEESDLVKFYQEIDIFIYKFNKNLYTHKLVEAIATFELIPLEAMASGCAVIASNNGALVEVVGEGGMLIENSEDNFYNGIKKLIDNKKLREGLQKKGRKKAETLTWEKCAREHLKIYEEIV